MSVSDDIIARDAAWEFGAFRLDCRNGLSRLNEAGRWLPVVVGGRALDVMRALVEAGGELVTKQALMDAAWPGSTVEDSNLTVQISALRRILDEDRAEASCIQTVIGRGYRFVTHVTLAAATGETEIPAHKDTPCSPTSIAVAATRKRRGSFWFKVAAVLLLMVGTGTGAWFWRTHTIGNPPPRLSLVVLPFEYVGSDATDDYLAAGITTDLTTALSHIPGTFVIARATANSYRGKAEDIRRIGQDLGVRYVVRGSVQRLGTVLRVNSELASTGTGAQLWSDGFDQTIADLAAGQEQIVIRMRSALNIRLVDIEVARGLRERPTDPDAYDLILRARATSLLPSTSATWAKALALYEQALELDPNVVPALTGAATAVLAVSFLDAMPYDAAMSRAVEYLERARRLEPNAESVLVAQSEVLDYQQAELDHQRVESELEAVARKLIDLYPNNTIGHFRLGVLRRNQGRYDEAAGFFETTIRLNPRNPTIKNLYWNMAICTILGGHDREGLGWADRTMVAEGALPLDRVQGLLAYRATAYVRTGDLDAAKRVARELNDRFPFDTWRRHAPRDPDSEKNVAQIQSFQEALKAAGNRDHADPDADFGIPPIDVLHLEFDGKTPITASRVTTVNTEQLAGMLRDARPLVIDTMSWTWYRSIPGAVGLDFHNNTHGSFTDEVQKRLQAKLHTLTGGDIAKPIVAVGFNSESFDGYNLALRLHHAGYTNVYWYRGGREAWEVAGMPEDVVRPAVW